MSKKYYTAKKGGRRRSRRKMRRGRKRRTRRTSRGGCPLWEGAPRRARAKWRQMSAQDAQFEKHRYEDLCRMKKDNKERMKKNAKELQKKIKMNEKAEKFSRDIEELYLFLLENEAKGDVKKTKEALKLADDYSTLYIKKYSQLFGNIVVNRDMSITLGQQMRDFIQLQNAMKKQYAGNWWDLIGGHRKKRRKTRKQRSTGKKGGKRRKTRKKGAGNGSSASSGSTASSSVAGPGSWIDELSSIDSSTITPTEPSTEGSSTKSSTESSWFFRGQQRPPSDLSGHGVGEDIRLLHGCEVATRSCPCHLPWKTGTCTYDKKRNLIYCKCRWKKGSAAEKIRRETNFSKAARAFTSSS